MADVKIEFHFATTFNQKEFSLVCRALAGHDIRPDEELLAAALNTRLLTLRSNQLKAYLRTSEMALVMARQEEQEINSAIQFLAGQAEVSCSSFDSATSTTRLETH